MENKLLSRLFVVSGPSQLLFLGAALKNHLRNDRKSYFNLLLLRGRFFLVTFENLYG